MLRTVEISSDATARARPVCLTLPPLPRRRFSSSCRFRVRLVVPAPLATPVLRDAGGGRVMWLFLRTRRRGLALDHDTRLRVGSIAWDVPDAAATVTAVGQGEGAVTNRLEQARREALTVRTWTNRHQRILARRGGASVTPRRTYRRIECGAPGWTRTSDPRLRRPVLYPTELRARRPIVTARARSTARRSPPSLARRQVLQRAGKRAPGHRPAVHRTRSFGRRSFMRWTWLSLDFASPASARRAAARACRRDRLRTRCARPEGTP